MQNSNSYLNALQEKYPVGNCDYFPHQRILKRTLGGKAVYWELTLLRLQIWANTLVRSFYDFALIAQTIGSNRQCIKKVYHLKHHQTPLTLTSRNASNRQRRSMQTRIYQLPPQSLLWRSQWNIHILLHLPGCITTLPSQCRRCHHLIHILLFLPV